MSSNDSRRWFSLIQRELREYRLSLVWTPFVLAGALALIMLAGVVVANQVSTFGEAVLSAILQAEGEGEGLELGVIIIDSDGKSASPPATSGLPAIPDASDPALQIERVPEAEEEAWNFSREWRFSPPGRGDRTAESSESGSPVETLNPLLQGVHMLMLLVLLVVSVHYALGSLFNDRRDRSILFWKSMPVAPREEVLAKLAVCLLVAPLMFLAASLLAQLAMLLLSVALVWRMGLDPVAQVLGNLEFARLLLDQVGGWLVTALWVAPMYAWCLLASAAARRSPFLLAIAPVLIAMLLESLLFGSSYLASAVQNHVPHYAGARNAVGFYLFGPDWGTLDLWSLLLGLLAAGLMLWAAIWLRRHRWEI
jgi:hypothetical protein